MIKNITLIIIYLLFYACGPKPQIIHSSINLADRHIWVPADENDLKKRRLRQTNFDGIAEDIETLFINLETLDPRETNIREGTKSSISEIENLESNRTSQISQEQQRVDNLTKELKEIRLNNNQINNQVVNIHLAPKFTKDEYLNAFHYFSKGHYIKSAKLFKNLLLLSPPLSLIDNILFGISMSHFKEKEYSSSIVPLNRIIEGYPDSEKWHMSNVMLALAHEKIGEKSQALYALEKSLKKNPPYFIQSVINNLIDLIQDETIPTKN